MERAQLNILGLSETRWKGNGDYISDEGIRVIFAGGQESQRGVALLLDKVTSRSVTKVIQHSDRLILVKLKATPVDIIVIQVYMPTTGHKDEEVERMYDEIEMSEKGSDNIFVLGDWNAVVGEGKEGDEVGGYSLVVRNDRGLKMVEFCKRWKFMITNTWFDQPKRRLYTWEKKQVIQEGTKLTTSLLDTFTGMG